jgi:hypothetical protein
VGADARPQALLALASAEVLPAYARFTAFLARAFDALVGAAYDARRHAHGASRVDARIVDLVPSAPRIDTGGSVSGHKPSMAAGSR